MNQMLFCLPNYIEPIIERLKEHDWLIYNFLLDENQNIYSVGDFLYNKKMENVHYTLYLDTNLYQFLLNSHKKKANEKSRGAICLLVFCQAAGIEIEPAYAVYEKINYEKKNADEAVKDLNLFHKINNAPMDSLALFGLGDSENYDLGRHEDIDIEQTKAELTKYRRLIDWDSMYVIVLAIINEDQKEASKQEKLKSFYDWLIRKFRLSLVGTCFAAIYFSNQPIKKMMKFKIKDPAATKRRQVNNMTWDLYIMDRFFKSWIDRDESDEFMYASDDRALREVLRVAIAIQNHDGFSPLKDIFHKSDYENLLAAVEQDVDAIERAYQSNEWTSEYRSLLISEFEERLLS